MIKISINFHEFHGSIKNLNKIYPYVLPQPPSSYI